MCSRTITSSFRARQYAARGIPHSREVIILFSSSYDPPAKAELAVVVVGAGERTTAVRHRTARTARRKNGRERFGAIARVGKPIARRFAARVGLLRTLRRTRFRRFWRRAIGAAGVQKSPRLVRICAARLAARLGRRLTRCRLTRFEARRLWRARKRAARADLGAAPAKPAVYA